jgi:hypothetical protein
MRLGVQPRLCFRERKIFPLVCFIAAWSLAKEEKAEGLLGS